LTAAEAVAMKTGPKGRVFDVEDAALMPANPSRAARRRKTEQSNPNISSQRRKRLLARAQRMAADIKARP
jgi:hypothetical protein